MSDTVRQDIDLGTEGGRPVTRARLIVKKTGSGLEESMKTDPAIYEHGQRIALVMDAALDQVRFDRITSKGEDTGQLSRVHIANAETVTVVDPDLVEEMLAKQRERNAIRREEEAGSVALDRALEEQRKELRGDHVLGLHNPPTDGTDNIGPQEHCELCAEEAADGE